MFLRRLCSSLLLVVLVAVPASVSSPATACMIVARAPVVVKGEESLIVWDEAHHREHFIRRANFGAVRGPFGFIVPTPSRPTLAEVDDNLFDRLSSIYIARDREIGGMGRAGGRALADGFEGGPQRVTVIAEQRVAGLDATILVATDASALTAWLSRHGLPTPRGMTEYLAPYVAGGYFITAFKYAPAANARRAADLSSRAVLMSFDTARPMFPYAEPPGARRVNGRRFRVSIISATKMRATLGEDAWSTPVGFAARTGSVHSIIPHAVPAGILPNEAWITTFDERNSRRGRDDLFFAADSDTRPVPSTIYDRIE